MAFWSLGPEEIFKGVFTCANLTVKIPITVTMVVPWLLWEIRHRLIGTAPFKDVNNCWNTKISSYLETSGALNLNLYLNVVH